MKGCSHAAIVAALVLTGGVLIDRGLDGHELVDYRTEVQPILDATCGGSGCHIGEAASGVDLTDYEKTMGSVGALYGGPAVVPGRAGESPLFLKVFQDTPQYGERMPPGVQLDFARMATIRSWIDEGARASPPAVIRGDADSDGSLSITDAIFVLGFLFLGTAAPDCPAAADADGDGSVIISDAINILIFLFLGGPALPPLTHEEEEDCLGLAPELSFQNIYEEVFAKGCNSTTCHSAAGVKGGLVLETIEAAYEGLVNAVPRNFNAREAGMLRVDPGRPENSFLVRKLEGPGLGEGNRMPLAASALSEDRLAAIREWILAGAPREGSIAGAPGITESPPPPPDRLEPPPAPENGIQLRLTPFRINARGEREVFELVDPRFTEDVFVNRIDFHMLENSHHFILYTWEDRNNRPPPGHRELGSSTGVGAGARRFIAASQQSFLSIRFPAGSGVRFDRGTLFDLNSHYINLDGEQPLTGEVYVNLFLEKPEDVTREVKPIFEGNFQLFIPPGETRTATRVWRVSRETHIHSLSSHMHRHGVHFRATRLSNPDDVVYESFGWDDPVNRIFEEPLVLPRGDGLRYECTHTNHDRDVALRFGLTSEDEMCFLLGFYTEE